jgi:hypothetical protein
MREAVMDTRIRKIGVALSALFVLCAVSASSSFGTATTSAANWYTGSGGGTKLVGGTFISTKVREKTSFVFETEVGTTRVKLAAKQVECVSCTVRNEPTGASGVGFLEFSEITVVSPPNCTLTSAKTKELSLNADYMEGTSAMVLLTPTAGSTTAFASFELQGGSCALSTPIVPKGTVFGKAANATGVQSTSQEVSVSPSINSTAGGSMVVGLKPAALEGTLIASFGTIVIGESPYFGVH